MPSSVMQVAAVLLFCLVATVYGQNTTFCVGKCAAIKEEKDCKAFHSPLIDPFDPKITDPSDPNWKPKICQNGDCNPPDHAPQMPDGHDMDAHDMDGHDKLASIPSDFCPCIFSDGVCADPVSNPGATFAPRGPWGSGFPPRAACVFALCLLFFCTGRALHPSPAHFRPDCST